MIQPIPARTILTALEDSIFLDILRMRSIIISMKKSTINSLLLSTSINNIVQGEYSIAISILIKIPELHLENICTSEFTSSARIYEIFFERIIKYFLNVNTFRFCVNNFLIDQLGSLQYITVVLFFHRLVIKSLYTYTE